MRGRIPEEDGARSLTASVAISGPDEAQRVGAIFHGEVTIVSGPGMAASPRRLV
jgi:hypothetical protein